MLGAEKENGRIPMDIKIKEAELTEELLETLIRLSADWEAEGSCHGYRKNERSDIEGNRIFVAEDCGKTVAYLFGHAETSKKASTIMPAGTQFFEVEEIYVRPQYRSLGVGSKLFGCAEQAVSGSVEFIMLSTATKNWRAILHFYLDELGMEFWNARLFKKV